MAKRTRSSSVVASPPPLSSIPAPKKQKKNAPQRFLCYSCDTEKTEKSFPDYNPTPDCDHLINTCKVCLKLWVQTQIESALYATGGGAGGEGAGDGNGEGEREKGFGVKCPQCPSIMRAVNVQLAVTKKYYAEFDQAERHHIAETTPGWRWCLSPDCDDGQVHTTTPKEAESKQKSKKPKRGKKLKDEDLVAIDDGDICTCNACGARACVPCDRPYHEGESCKVYQRRTKDRMDEEDKSLREIRKVTKKCPNCSKNIQKNGGCNSMYCKPCLSRCLNAIEGKGSGSILKFRSSNVVPGSQCNINFCWNCVQVFDQGFCKCNPRPAPAPALAPAPAPAAPGRQRVQIQQLEDGLREQEVFGGD